MSGRLKRQPYELLCGAGQAFQTVNSYTLSHAGNHQGLGGVSSQLTGFHPMFVHRASSNPSFGPRCLA